MIYTKKVGQFVTVVALMLGGAAGQAQDFLDGFDAFSGKKPAYLELNNGEKVEGTIHDLDRKKGLIEEITLKDANGKKKAYKPTEIKNMYLAPSGYNKLTTALDNSTRLNKLTRNTHVDDKLINEGYAYFEQSEVMLKGKKQVLMLQLLNPSFADRIKVYQNPMASETVGLGIGGITVAGGDDRSYFVRKDNDTATLVKKKDYDENFERLYGDCGDYLKKNKKNMSWAKFSKTIFDYTEQCTK